MWEQRMYRWLTDDNHDGRACDAISDDACHEAPRSFMLNASNGAATKLAEQLASPGLVLPWLLSAVGAPVVLVGWLEPIRQGGSLLPQLLVAAQLRARPVRKWFWVGAGSVQALALLAMAIAVATLDGVRAGWLVLAALAVFSVASGVGSVAFLDVVGKTIPKGKRGQLLGVRATAGGLLTLAAGIALRFGGGAEAGRGLYLLLLVAAASLWAAAALLFAAIPELEGATKGGRNAIGQVRAGLRLLATHRWYRRYLGARAGLLATELSIPFFALHARSLGLSGADLGLAIVSVGLANLLSSPILGRLSDRVSSRLVMAIGGASTLVTVAYVLTIARLFDGTVSSTAYAPAFFLIGLALSAVRLGRKTYLIDAADDDQRPTLVALSNTSVGVLTFAYGALGWLAATHGPEATLAAVALLALAGSVAALATGEPET